MKNVQNFRNQINRTYRNATNSMRSFVWCNCLWCCCGWLLPQSGI